MKKWDVEELMLCEEARSLHRFLEENREKISPLLILTHDYPDPDALASAFALQHLAEKAFGIESRIVYGGVIGRMENRAMVQTLRIPVHKVKRADFKKFEHVALVDTQPSFQNNAFPKNRKPVLVIDQHPSAVKPSADLAVIDTGCGATCVIVAQALLLSQIEIPPRIATALAYGILSDTMDFYRVNRADVVQTYLQILPHCDMKELAHIQNPVRSRKFFTILGQAIQNTFSRRGILIAVLGYVDNPDLVSQIADFLLTYKTAHWVLCFGRYRGKLYVSLRTNKVNVQAGEILRDIMIKRGKAGGWGPIAGGSIDVGREASDETWQEVGRALTERFLKRVRVSSKNEWLRPFRRSESVKPQPNPVAGAPKPEEEDSRLPESKSQTRD